jgi:hypothetical protein
MLSIISHNKKEPGSGKVIDTSRTRLRRRIPPRCIIHIEEAEVKRELGKLVCGIAACAYAHQEKMPKKSTVNPEEVFRKKEELK